MVDKCAKCGTQRPPFQIVPSGVFSSSKVLLCDGCHKHMFKPLPLRQSFKFDRMVIDDLIGKTVFAKDPWFDPLAPRKTDEIENFINRLDFIPKAFYFETPKGLILEVSSAIKATEMEGYPIITIITQDGKRLPIMEPIEKSTIDNPGVPIEIKIPFGFIHDSTNPSALILRGRQLGASFWKDFDTRSLIIQFLNRENYLKFVEEFPIVLKGFNDNPILP